MENLDFPMPERRLFNGAVETGIRSLVILNAAYPRMYDINELVWFDHLVVHSEDIGGPPSIHPKIPQRTGEVLVRRSLVQDGLDLMRRYGLIEIAATENGVCYQATDSAYPLVQLLSSQYSKELKNRAEWLVEFVTDMTSSAIKELVLSKLGNWKVEFQGDQTLKDMQNDI